MIKSRKRYGYINNIPVFMDGPQLVTLRGPRKSRWIGVAISEYENISYPIYCSRMSTENFIKYINGSVDLLYLFKYGKYNDYMVFDFKNCKKDGKVTLHPSIYNEKFFPEAGFFFDDHTENLNYEKEDLLEPELHDENYVVNIDGNWELPEFSSFSEKMSTVYTFLHCIRQIEKIPEDKRSKKLTRLEETFEDHPWKGGFSYVHFYNDLYGSIPANDRLAVDEIRYASPGFIKLDGNPTTFDDLNKSLISLRDNYKEITDKYRNLYYFLQSNKILSTVASEKPKDMSLLNKTIMDLTKDLSNSVSLYGLDDIYKYSGENWIVTSKIILSYFRRLKSLFEFYSEGRAQIVE